MVMGVVNKSFFSCKWGISELHISNDISRRNYELNLAFYILHFIHIVATIITLSKHIKRLFVVNSFISLKERINTWNKQVQMTRHIHFKNCSFLLHFVFNSLVTETGTVGIIHMHQFAWTRILDELYYPAHPVRLV